MGRKNTPYRFCLLILLEQLPQVDRHSLVISYFLTFSHKGRKLPPLLFSLHAVEVPQAIFLKSPILFSVFI